MVRSFSVVAAVLVLVAGISIVDAGENDPHHDLTVVVESPPTRLDAGDVVSVVLEITNDGSLSWSTDDGFALAYHWLDLHGEPVVWDGRRTALPRVMAAGDSVEMEAILEAPPQAGEYFLVWDLVHERVLWVSEVDPTPVTPIPISVSVQTSHRFSLQSADPPRVMVAGSQTAMAIRLRNDGTRVWPEDGTVNASYQWLSLGGDRVPGEGHGVLLEGRRTRFQDTVSQGESASMRIVIDSPPRGGLYRLQIDMVEEGVCWFSDRQPDPPPARTVLVIANPLTSPGWWAFLSLLGAAAAAATLHRGGPPALVGIFAAGDVIWLVGSLVLKQSFVLAGAVNRPGVEGWLLMVAGAAAIALLTRILPVRFRAWGCWLAAAAATLVLWGDAVYLRFFGDLPGPAALSAVGQVGQIEASVRSLLMASDLWLWLDLLPGIVVVLVARRLQLRSGRWLHRGVVLVLIVLVLPGVVTAKRLEVEQGRRLRQVFRRVRVAKNVGILNLHGIEIGRQLAGVFSRAKLSPEEEREIVDWFRERAPLRAGVGPWFGAADGFNLIMLQVESLQGFVVGLEIEGREVTPFLNELRDRALYFSNFGDQTLDGRSSDSEFSTQVSLLPSTGGAAAFLHDDNDFTGLAEVLAAEGYETLSAVPFDGSFWNRRTTHRAYGYGKSLFTEDFPTGEKVGWGLNDRDFLRLMANRVGRVEQPFAAYLLTLSLHHPFDGFPVRFQTFDVGPWAGTPFGNFLHTMHFFDQALAGFFAELEREGLADKTVVALWGDHDAGFKWRSEIAEVTGFSHDNIGWYLSQEVPLFIVVPGREGAGGELLLSTGHVDVAPTLIALLGIDPAPYAFVGRNLLGEPGDQPIVGEFDCWRDSRHLFIRGSGNLADGSCIDATNLKVLPVSECAAGFAVAEKTVAVSAAVLEHDLQREIHLRLIGETSHSE